MRLLNVESKSLSPLRDESRTVSLEVIAMINVNVNVITERIIRAMEKQNKKVSG